MTEIAESDRRRLRLDAVETALRIHREAAHEKTDTVLDTARKVAAFAETAATLNISVGSPRTVPQKVNRPEAVTPIFVGTIEFDPTTRIQTRRDADGNITEQRTLSIVEVLLGVEIPTGPKPSER